MSIWIVRFLPYAGPHLIDARFRSEKAARKIYDAASAEFVSESAEFRFKDDFGLGFSIRPGECACVLTNVESNAAAQAALSEASHDAARLYGLAEGQLKPGSTVQ